MIPAATIHNSTVMKLIVCVALPIGRLRSTRTCALETRWKPAGAGAIVPRTDHRGHERRAV